MSEKTNNPFRLHRSYISFFTFCFSSSMISFLERFGFAIYFVKIPVNQVGAKLRKYFIGMFFHTLAQAIIS